MCKVSNSWFYFCKYSKFMRSLGWLAGWCDGSSEFILLVSFLLHAVAWCGYGVQVRKSEHQTSAAHAFLCAGRPPWDCLAATDKFSESVSGASWGGSVSHLRSNEHDVQELSV